VGRGRTFTSLGNWADEASSQLSHLLEHCSASSIYWTWQLQKELGRLTHAQVEVKLYVYK
jgi:hypothetical protein